MIITLEEALASGRGNERPFNCISPDHDDQNASASVNVTKGVWYCYSCMASGTVGDHVPTVEEAVAVLAGTKDARVYPESWLDLYDTDHVSPYWAARVGVEVAHSNRCGTDPFGLPTYPIRDPQGRLMGVVTRHEDDPKQKYHYPFRVSTSRTLYGSLKPCRVLVLVEGAGDVMALQQAGVPRGWGAAGVYGAGIHHPQLELIHAMNPRLIVAGFDNDEAGQKAGDRARTQLTEMGYFVASDPWSSIGVKDAGAAPVSKRIPAIRAAIDQAGLSHLLHEETA